MRAVGVLEYGGPEALRVVELPDPQAGPGEILIRVHAAAVNPTDTFVRNGARADAQQSDGPPPYVPGMDAAGVVEAIGEGTETSLEVGDHVMAIVVPRGSHGAYSEKVVVPVESVSPVPSATSDVEACTLPMNGLTARLALDSLGLARGKTVAVTGAAGGFGGYVVQLAKDDGLRVIADASEADEKLVYELGADVVVRRGDDVAERIRETAPGGVDGLVDGAVLNQKCAEAAADGAKVITVRGYHAQAERGVSFEPIWVRWYWKEQAKLDRLRQQAEDGRLTLRVARTFPAEEAADAHRLLEAGGVRGRLVIEF